MIDVALLAYVPDPFAVRESSYMVRTRGDGDCTLTAADLSAFDEPILTIDLPSLVDDLRRLHYAPPARLLDFGEAVRLGVGLSKDDGGERLWNIWPILARRFANARDAESYRLIMLARAARPPASELARLLSAALDAMQSAWSELTVRLQEVGELDRLIQVEWPLQSLFAYRQYRGIRVDPERAVSLLAQISAEKYGAYRTVAETLNRSPTGLTFRTIAAYLAHTDVAHLAEVAPDRLQDAFELAADKSNFAAAFLSMTKASRDEMIVRRALGGDGWLFPVFTVLGTISGRILVSDPYLQQLRRRYRDLITSDANKRLIYLDYAQFEPGVLAGLSGDAELVRAYNAGDLYTELAKSLFGDISKRPVAKQVFLAFSYGMTPDRIALMLGSHGFARERDNIATTITGFFARFPGLKQFRAGQEETLERAGAVSSVFGNRRIRQTAGPLTHKERRWALNQPIQSTASLIFKEALVRIEALFGRDAVILPMHDAVLMQFEDDDAFDAKVEAAAGIMADAFRVRFPHINPRVTTGAFADA